MWYIPQILAEIWEKPEIYRIRDSSFSFSFMNLKYDVAAHIADSDYNKMVYIWINIWILHFMTIMIYKYNNFLVYIHTLWHQEYLNKPPMSREIVFAGVVWNLFKWWKWQVLQKTRLCKKVNVWTNKSTKHQDIWQTSPTKFGRKALTSVILYVIITKEKSRK